MSKLWVLTLAVAVLLLLTGDVLAFHDLLEPHTARDWIMLVGSLMAFVALVGPGMSHLRRATPE